MARMMRARWWCWCTLALLVDSKFVYRGKDPDCQLLVGLDYKCPMHEISPTACHVKAVRAETACNNDVNCAAVVSSDNYGTLKTDFNWTLGRLVAPEVTAQCEELVRSFRSGSARGSAGSATERGRTVKGQTECQQFRALGCLDYAHGGACCCSTARCARRLIASAATEPGRFAEGRPAPTRPHSRFCEDGRRSAVIGAAWGYKDGQLLFFMRSYHEAIRRHAQAILLVHADAAEPSNGVATSAKRWGLQLAVAERDYMLAARLRALGIEADCPALLSPYTGRFFHAEALLAAHRECFDRVLLTDTRDVYFQADVFAHMRDGLYAYQEEVCRGPNPGRCSVERNPYNRLWLRHVLEFARIAAAGLKPELRPEGGLTPIVCSGVVGGEVGALLEFVRAMVGLAMRIGRAGFAHAGLEVITGLDQGIHNWLVRRGTFRSNVTVLSNEEGPVFHNVCFDPAWLTSGVPAVHAGLRATPEHATDPVMELRNGDRTQVAALVHQFDRCKSLTKKVKEHFERPERPHRVDRGGSAGEPAVS